MELKCVGLELMSRDIKDSCAGPVPTFHLEWKAVRPRTQSNASKTHEKTALEMPNKDRCRFVLTTNLCTHLIHRCNRVVKLGPGRLAGRHFHHCATYAPDISLLPAAQNAITSTDNWETYSCISCNQKPESGISSEHGTRTRVITHWTFAAVELLPEPSTWVCLLGPAQNQFVWLSWTSVHVPCFESLEMFVHISMA